jgi:hypothetical protein
MTSMILLSRKHYKLRTLADRSSGSRVAFFLSWDTIKLNLMEDKIYVGSGVAKFDGDLISCSLCLTDLPQEHMFEYQGKKYIKLNVSAKKNGADEYGKTHYVAVDTWKPEAKAEEKAEANLPF